MPCVGSWFSQKSCSIASYDVTFGSKTASTTSAWPVAVEHTSSYDGFGVKPPA